MNCSCGIKANMTWDQLAAIARAGSCTSPRWLCSDLDKALRRADAERQRRAMYDKRLKRQGYSEEDIANRPMKKRRSSKTIVEYKEVDVEIEM